MNPDKKSTRKIDVLTREELSLLLDSFKKYFPKHYPLALTLSRTGMRFGEVCALKWEDIDFNGRFLLVQRSFSSGYRMTSPKSGKERRVDMSMQLTEVLWRLKRERLKQYGEDIPTWVFINTNGGLVDQSGWRRRVFEKTLEKAEIRHIRVHDLRHTCVSLLLQDGASMMYVKELLGHSSIKITVDVYGHLQPGDNRENVDRLDDVSPLHPTAPYAHPETKITHGENRKSLKTLEPMEGVEPPTLSLQVRCSSQLSYIGIV